MLEHRGITEGNTILIKDSIRNQKAKAVWRIHSARRGDFYHMMPLGCDFRLGNYNKRISCSVRLQLLRRHHVMEEFLSEGSHLFWVCHYLFKNSLLSRNTFVKDIKNQMAKQKCSLMRRWNSLIGYKWWFWRKPEFFTYMANPGCIDGWKKWQQIACNKAFLNREKVVGSCIIEFGPLNSSTISSYLVLNWTPQCSLLTSYHPLSNYRAKSLGCKDSHR